MKKILLSFLILFAVIASVMIGSSYFQMNKNPIIDTSPLKSVNVNGSNYKTTGAIPNQDDSLQKKLDEIIRLGSMGPITEEGYKIIVEGQGNVVIELKSSSEKNKETALTWLKNNGFTNISQGDITFRESK